MQYSRKVLTFKLFSFVTLGLWAFSAAAQTQLRCDPYSRGENPLLSTIDATKKKVSLKEGDDIAIYIDGRKSQEKEPDEPVITHQYMGQTYYDHVGKTGCILDKAEYVDIDDSKIRFGIESRNVNTCGLTGSKVPPGAQSFGSSEYSIDRDTGILRHWDTKYQCKVSTGKVIP